MIKKNVKAKEEVECDTSSAPNFVPSYDGIINKNFEQLDRSIVNLEEVISILFKRINPVVNPDYKNAPSNEKIVGINNECDVSNVIKRQYYKIEGLIDDVASITQFIEL